MSMNPKAGKPASKDELVDIPALVSAYYSLKPDASVTGERVAFGTSGHRGKAFKKSFNEAHIRAVTQATYEYRKKEGIEGPLFIGKDSHALSTPAQITAIEVLAANGVSTLIAEDDGYTATPQVSFAILEYNKNGGAQADGIIITPSHNPPEDGGFKYNPPNGGPADVDATSWIENRANEILAQGIDTVPTLSYEEALESEYINTYDYVTPYVEALTEIVDMDAIAKSGIRIGVDPLGGASVDVYQKINEIYGLDMDIVNPYIDPTFSFMTLDHDGKIRMDCSSPSAMASLVALKDKYDIAFANDADSDRHGIVTPTIGLMNPNHYLSVAIWYLFGNRPEWDKGLKIGKTLVSSAMIDRVADDLGVEVLEVPVGFKWFVEGLFEGTLGFGGEESAGASFLRSNGKVWSTDKDGIILNLLAAEMWAKLGKDPSQLYAVLEEKFGRSYYKRVDAPATPEQKAAIKAIDPEKLSLPMLAGEKVEKILTKAEGNAAAIGGLKVISQNGWFAMRPSGTEDIYKIYAESFLSEDHLEQILKEAQSLVSSLLD
ncbi:MAG: phosphoglucomutase (alpha-D-glucose-1,6-bisphosphate-dependent) [Campylobacterota bacterium]|nr:phosphoglucomutase (alpha-D-glucose-1,6-bisphosphate-dependent) [Campylobacterota bacterium]